MERILESHLFRSSARCSGLLRHIIERTIAGDVARLKERTIGVDVFHRPPDYDTSQDPVVRATAAEVRKKLAQYYEEDGHASEQRVRIVPGSYVADFGDRRVEVRRTRAFVSRAAWPALALLIILGAGSAVFRYLSYPKSDLDAFWAPVLKAPGPVLIYLEDAVAYSPVSAERQRNLQTRTDPGPPLSDSALIPRTDLIALPGRYAHMGEVRSLVRMTSWLSSRSKTYRMLSARPTAYTNLGDTPLLLLSVSDDLPFSKALPKLRFSVARDAASGIDVVRDASHPEKTPWQVSGAWPLWEISEDYAVITLVRRHNAAAPVVIVSSVTGYGSSAVGEFLTSAESFARASLQLPAKWKAQNVQIVLRIPLVNGAAGVADIVATHTW